MAHRRAVSADSDPDDVWYHIAKESGSVDRADQYVGYLTERLYLLSQNPHIGRRRDDLRPGLRSFPIRQHVIFYRLEGDDVVILHVLHGARDIEAFFRQ